jgi:lysyl-tRNA synthetase class 2
MLSRIRRFFAERGVLEVETPLLCHAAGTDPNLQPFIAEFRQPGQSHGVPLYLQTSPEFAMKRLLAADSGSIYQVCKAFRNEEAGRFHNPEFTILEWYRVGFGLDELMDEVDALLACVLAGVYAVQPARRIAYRELFRQHTGLDPITASVEEFIACAQRYGLPEAEMLCGEERSLWLDVLFSHVIQPRLGELTASPFEKRGLRGISYSDCERSVSKIPPTPLFAKGGTETLQDVSTPLIQPCFVHSYPALLPSLARIKPDEPEVVERVEVFINGIELGNGYHELADANEQERRFDADLLTRQTLGLALPPKDTRLLAALQSGLPDCAGIALGLDRLLILQTDADHIEQVLAFPVANS